MTPGGDQAEPGAPAGHHDRRVGMFTTDADLTVTSWDPVLTSMTGIRADAAKGKPLTAVIPDLEARGLLPLLRETLSSGAPQVFAPALHHYLIPCAPVPPSPEYDRMQQRVSVGVLRDDSRIVGLVVTVEDVTGRLERERVLGRRLREGSVADRRETIEQLAALEPVEGLGPLGAAIGDEDWQVRRSAVRALATRNDRALVGTLVSALREGHRDFSVLSSALQLLAMTGVDLTTALVELLRDPDPDLRLQAALALGSQSRPEAVDALIAALTDEDTNVRFHAIEALGKLRPSAAVGPLAAIVESGDFFLVFPALEALTHINDPAVVPRILPLLGDVLLAAPAADALGQIGDEDAVGPLLATIERPEAPVSSIIDALAAIHRRYDEMFAAGGHVEDLVRRAATATAAQRIIDAAPQTTGVQLRNLVEVLGWLRGPAVERAMTRLLGTAAIHHEVVEAIVRFGPAMVDRLTEQLAQDDLDARRAAAVALGRIGDRRAVPALIGLLESERELIAPAAGALARIGDPRAFEALVSLLGDADLSVRHAAIGALNSIGHPEMGSRMRALLDDADVRVRESAVKIAGYFGYAECVDGVLARCTDPDENVRAAALESAAYLDDARTAPVLAAAARSGSARVRAAAARALGQADDESAGETLRLLLHDPDSWVRYFAAIGLGRRGDAAGTAVLEGVAANDQAPHVRIAAIEALSATGGESAAGLLAPFVQSDNTEIAAAAVRALGTVSSEAAAEPLRKAVASDDAAVRGAAVEALTRWGHPSAIDQLRRTASADPDPSVVASAFRGLATLAGGPQDRAVAAVSALATLAADSKRQDEAAAALAR